MATTPAGRKLDFGAVQIGQDWYKVTVDVTAPGDKCPKTQADIESLKRDVQSDIWGMLLTHGQIWKQKHPGQTLPPEIPKFFFSDRELEYHTNSHQTLRQEHVDKAQAAWKKFESRFIAPAATPRGTSDPSGAVDVTPKRVAATVTREQQQPAAKVRQESKQPLERSDSNLSNSELPPPGEDDFDAPPERQDSGMLSGLFKQAKAMLPGAKTNGQPGLLVSESDDGPGEVPAESPKFVANSNIPVPTEYSRGLPGTAFMKPAGQQGARHRSSEASFEGPSRPTHLATPGGKKAKQETVKSTLPPGYEYDQALWKRFRDHYGKVIDRTITLQGLIEKLGEEHEDVATLKQMQGICRAEHVFRTKQKERANGQAAQTGKPLGLADRVDQGPDLDEVTRTVLRYHVIKRDQEMAAALPRSYSDLGEL